MKSSRFRRQLGFSHSWVASLGLCFFAVLLFPKTALGQTLEKVDIPSCYDGDTCTSSTGEKIRLACIDTPELRDKQADLIPAKAVRDSLRQLVVVATSLSAVSRLIGMDDPWPSFSLMVPMSRNS